MNKNKFGEIVYSEDDLVDLLMKGHDLPESLIVDSVPAVDKTVVESIPDFHVPTDSNHSVEDYDTLMQSNWYMPDEYKSFDIAKYCLDLCTSDEQLQRVGKELLLFQERNLFDLLKYLKYLVDTMKQNGIIWGVGRGSSVASYVLYLLEVHRIDSIYYELDPEEFLR